MKQISPEEIEVAWEELENEESGAFERAAREFAEKQPFLLVYVLSLATDDAEAETLRRPEIYFFGAVVYHVFSKRGQELFQVDDKAVEAREESNVFELENASDAEMEKLLAQYNQGPMLAKLVQALAELQEDQGESPNQEEFARDLLRFKTLIDCLDQ